MSDSEVQAALNYYHDLTIFLYFSKILRNVVFLHPQPLFNKLSDLISISFANVVDYLEEEGIPIHSYDAHEELKNFCQAIMRKIQDIDQQMQYKKRRSN